MDGMGEEFSRTSAAKAPGGLTRRRDTRRTVLGILGTLVVFVPMTWYLMSVNGFWLFPASVGCLLVFGFVFDWFAGHRGGWRSAPAKDVNGRGIPAMYQGESVDVSRDNYSSK